MKYFTPEMYVALQDFDPTAMAAAEAAWEKAVDRYEAYLQSIQVELPTTVRELLDRFYLHDAGVLSMGQQDDTFTIVLQLDPPPRELLTITYALGGEPALNREALPPRYCSERPLWLHDEMERRQEDNQCVFVHSILLSNGWEVQLRFKEVQLTTAQPLFPPAVRTGISGHPLATAEKAT